MRDIPGRRPRSSSGPVRRSRLGLRSRVAGSWFVGAALITAILGVVTYGLSRTFLVKQREDVAIRQATANARVVRDTVRSGSAAPGALVSSLRTDAGGAALVRVGERWFTASVGPGPDDLTPSLVQLLAQGASGHQRIEIGGEPYIAVAISIPSVSVGYVELFPVESLVHLLGVLRNSLVFGALTAALLAALLGSWSTRRVLRPVTRVAGAAQELARGTLDRRLAPERDPDLDRLVSSFNSMVDAVERRIDREVRFASDVSHELRSPLATLTAAADVLDRRRGELPERAAEAVGMIVEQVERLSRMVIDLLEIARIDAGVADVHLDDESIGSLTQGIARGQGLAAAVRVTDDAAPARAAVDRRRFEQILRNLFDNAQKYGGGVVRVLVDTDGDRVLVAVDDAGPAVPVAERTRIFERFTRGSTTQGTPGTGLGLALAREHATLMGGDIHVSRSAEGGARFVVVLPRTDRGQSS